MPVTVTLPGPAPWGFRIAGGRDFGKPITVSKVAEHGKAAVGDLRPGDLIVTINGESAAEMLNVEAQNKIKQSPGQLRLQVERMRCGCRRRAGAPGEAPAPRPAAPCPAAKGKAGRDGQGPGRLRYLLMAPSSPHSSQLMEEIASPGLCQERGSLHSSPGSALPPPPRPPSPGLEAPPNPWDTPGERRSSSCSPNPCSSPGSEPAMRRLEEDSEVLKMLQENRELRAAPRQSSTFRLLQEALEDEAGGEGGSGCGRLCGVRVRPSRPRVPAAPFPSRLSPSARKPAPGLPRLPPCEKCGSGIATQAVRIRDGRYRHPSCYACADCGLNLKMRGHFWAGDELYCEKHAKLRYQGPPGGTRAPTVPPHS
ncbi:PDZ and LIM domain protein 2 isoform X1 [Pezoporus flaviventris]|uniref:PDZ and LIM domain protein 2 isoform X1 n=1 Tax=Pezoporus flaviventris TaxID=889875 RepID=UPI002AB28B3C|nr:PDZ and LIM domain protein 2 isoform X1 [Pezoporus flaviventris]